MKKYWEAFARHVTCDIATRRLLAATPKGSASRLRINVSRGRACSDVSNYVLILDDLRGRVILALVRLQSNNTNNVIVAKKDGQPSAPVLADILSISAYEMHSFEAQFTFNLIGNTQCITVTKGQKLYLFSYTARLRIIPACPTF